MEQKCNLFHTSDFCTIWKTFDIKKKHPYVAKRYNSRNKKFVDLDILKEIRLLNHLSHSNIIKLQDIIVSEAETKNDDNVIVLLEPVETDFASLERSKFIFESEEELTILLFQGLKALEHMHSNGIAHCDIRPRHLLLSHTFELKICDFKSAKPANSDRISNDITALFMAFANILDLKIKSFIERLISKYELSSLSASTLLKDEVFSEFESLPPIKNDSFQWKRNCTHVHGIDTIIHLISLEKAKCHEENTCDEKTSEQLALECELEHGVQCGEQFNISRMKFENDRMRLDHEEHIADNIFNQIFGNDGRKSCSNSTNDSGVFTVGENGGLKKCLEAIAEEEHCFMSHGSHLDIGTELSFAWMDF